MFVNRDLIGGAICTKSRTDSRLINISTNYIRTIKVNNAEAITIIIIKLNTITMGNAEHNRSPFLMEPPANFQRNTCVTHRDGGNITQHYRVYQFLV